MGAPSEEPGVYRTSRYNLCIPHPGGALLYNTLHGSVIGSAGEDAAASMRALATPNTVVPEGALPPEQLLALVDAGFVVPRRTDELSVIKQRFDRARNDAPIALTITTTMDCNLGCYYCYEDRTGDQLSVQDDVEPLLALARDRLTRANKRFLHVDWYGGEPMLNVAFIEAVSPRLQALCEELGAEYQASIISNGTRWPADVGDFLARHRVAEVQVTFDGLQDNHEKRRHYRRSHRRPEDDSSFTTLVSLVDELVKYVQVDLRFNIDRGNAADFIELVGFARGRGWFDGPHPVEVHPARLSKYSERSEFMRKRELSPAEFADVREAIQAVAPEALVQNSYAPDGFPVPRTTVCAALATDSVVVGADRQLYRCGLQVGETSRSVGAVASGRRLAVLREGPDDSEFWQRFDPTQMPRCRVCTFLPVCWSGCPKSHLERDAQAVREQGEYWRTHLPSLVARAHGIELSRDTAFSHAEQFPDGEPETYVSA